MVDRTKLSVYQNHSVLTYTTLAFRKSDIGEPSLFLAAFSSILKMEIADSFKMMVPMHQTTTIINYVLKEP
jgi:hypothetical protein